MNDIIFSQNFIFCTITFDRFHHTDNRRGAPRHYFACMLRGHGRIVGEAGTVTFRQGDIFYIPDQYPYQSYWYGEPEIRFVSLGFPCLPNFNRSLYPPQVIPDGGQAAVFFEELGQKARLTAQDIGKFYTLTGLLLPHMVRNTPSRSEALIRCAEAYLMHNPHAAAPEIAQNCAVSASALYAAFHTSGGQTLHQMKKRMLLEKARDMLIGTDRPVEEISGLLRFSSASYFRKQFLRQFGMTPSEMRRHSRI